MSRLDVKNIFIVLSSITIIFTQKIKNKQLKAIKREMILAPSVVVIAEDTGPNHRSPRGQGLDTG